MIKIRSTEMYRFFKQSVNQAMLVDIKLMKKHQNRKKRS